MSEQMYGESFAPEKENAKRLKYTLSRLKEYEHFVDSPFVSHIIEKNGGLNEDERKKMKETSISFRDSVSETFKDSNIEVKEDNHLAHILGNSILTSADAYANNFEKGKYTIGEGIYFVEDESHNEVPLEILSPEEMGRLRKKISDGSRFIQKNEKENKWVFKENFGEEERRRRFPEFSKEKTDKIISEIGLLNKYISEVANDSKMAKMELSSDKGILEGYLDYIKCDLPTQSPKRIELIMFFRDIENRKITKENFEERTNPLQDLLDIEIIKQKWNI